MPTRSPRRRGATALAMLPRTSELMARTPILIGGQMKYEKPRAKRQRLTGLMRPQSCAPGQLCDGAVISL